MSRRAPLSLGALLNPEDPVDASANPEDPVDASADFRALLDALGPLDRPFLVAPNVHRRLQEILTSCTAPPPVAQRRNPPPATMAVARSLALQADPDRTVEYNVRVSDKTILARLYTYPAGACVEYPESGDVNPVGHLLPIAGDLDSPLPWTDFAYSKGAPDGGSGKNEFYYTPVLVDDHGVEVACKVRHATYLGMKACPLADLAHLRSSYQHTSATRADVEEHLAAEREARLLYSSPSRDIFQTTAAYITAVRTAGCRRPQQEAMPRTEQELQQFEQDQAASHVFRRRYPVPKTCDGRIVFHEIERDSGPSTVYLSCQHYSAHRSPNHWVDFSIRDAGYNIDYIAAVFTDDREEAERIELEAKVLDIGPLAKCKTVVDYSAQRSYCPVDHRLEGRLVQQEMAHLQCDVKFRIWWPVDRTKCPYALVTSRGTHRHPVPLPLKTPNAVRSQILSLLQSVRQDLPDMTARRFLRHPAIKSRLFSIFPHLSNPTLSHLHPSLANRAHLSAYITRAKKEHFPEGTDWKGVVRLKKLQDEQLPLHEHYIQLILELNNDSLVVHEEDEPALPGDKNTRIIICMSTDSSKRLQDTQYLQSDIGFKRIVGFDEFEIAAMDCDANTSVVFCRAYVTRHTAAAHQRIFDELNKIVMLDTGSPLRWRHLHGQSPEDFQGLILQWGADQHRGQAKGTSIASALTTTSVDCTAFAKSTTTAISAPVLMRSLACIRHSDWDGTIAQILASGSKAGTDWVRDKESCKFAFPGICWEKSFIPLAVWNAGESNTNLIETVHSDVNREGQYEAHGIRPSYAAITPVTNAVKNVKRRECLPLTPGVISPSSTPEYHRQLSVARVTACQAQNKYNSQVQVGTRLRESGASGVILPISQSNKLINPYSSLARSTPKKGSDCIYSLSYWDFDIDDFILAPKKKTPTTTAGRTSTANLGRPVERILLLVRRPSTFSSETDSYPMPIPIQISESLANALVRSIQIRHDLIYGGIAPRPPAVAVWRSYFAASMDLLQMTWFGPAHAEDATTLTQRVRTLCTLACALDALEAQGHPTAPANATSNY
ncbi:hypothetical protein B0H14DRAFT_2631317 [Mycena olivaceomarginata]|nr:hypothetical protein B0H14DRAFT_2631317 [Mycena olivaceomarginata]